MKKVRKFLFTWVAIFISFATISAAESEIVLKTTTGDIFGSILTPENDQKDVVVLFISGSGPTDRDGNNPQMKNNSILNVNIKKNVRQGDKVKE